METIEYNKSFLKMQADFVRLFESIETEYFTFGRAELLSVVKQKSGIFFTLHLGLKLHKFAMLDLPNAVIVYHLRKLGFDGTCNFDHDADDPNFAMYRVYFCRAVNPESEG